MALFSVKQDLHFPIYFRRNTVNVAPIPVLQQNTLRRKEKPPAGTDYLQSETLWWTWQYWSEDIRNKQQISA